jgi:hypothetical protein
MNDTNLKTISTKGKRAARTVLYSRALLLLDAGECGPKWHVEKVAEALGVTSRSLEHLKKRFVEQGVLPPLNAKNGLHLRERYNLAANLKHNSWHWPVRKRLKGEVGGPFDF